jgi:hypothetical protein
MQLYQQKQYCSLASRSSNAASSQMQQQQRSQVQQLFIGIY